MKNLKLLILMPILGLQVAPILGMEEQPVCSLECHLREENCEFEVDSCRFGALQNLFQTLFCGTRQSRPSRPLPAPIRDPVRYEQNSDRSYNYICATPYDQAIARSIKESLLVIRQTPGDLPSGIIWCESRLDERKYEYTASWASTNITQADRFVNPPTKLEITVVEGHDDRRYQQHVATWTFNFQQYYDETTDELQYRDDTSGIEEMSEMIYTGGMSGRPDNSAGDTEQSDGIIRGNPVTTVEMLHTDADGRPPVWRTIRFNGTLQEGLVTLEMLHTGDDGRPVWRTTRFNGTLQEGPVTLEMLHTGDDGRPVWRTVQVNGTSHN